MLDVGRRKKKRWGERTEGRYSRVALLLILFVYLPLLRVALTSSLPICRHIPRVPVRRLTTALKEEKGEK